MYPFDLMPLQTDGIKLLSGSSPVITFPVTFDSIDVSIASAIFGVKRTFGGEYTKNITCVVSGSSCVATLGEWVGSGEYIGELTVTLSDGNVYTPLQFPITLV